ncbi:phycobilisome linker polypeptide [Calothrix sp. NIES-4101]|nr:phycobilisome linker polypeptide [Calothrix sp. NIES-4101]
MAIGRTSELGVSLFENTPLLELVLSNSKKELESIICAVCR